MALNAWQSPYTDEEKTRLIRTVVLQKRAETTRDGPREQQSRKENGNNIDIYT